MSTIRSELHTSLVSQTLDDIFYRRSNYFYFLGKVEPWADEQLPPTVGDALVDDITIRNNMVYLKRVAPDEVSLVAPRYTWKSGTIYSCWDHTQPMINEPFYVVNADYNVYKCLDNSARSTSTEEPTSVSLFPFRTADGYLWKYMYNIPSFKRVKFLSRGYMPVQKALTDVFYNKGAIEQIVVTNPGSGYTDSLLTSIDVVGTTTGSGATAHITSVGPLGQITGLQIDDGGADYTYGAAVSIASTSGTGADITAVVTGGVITDLTIVSGGFGYTVDDVVDISVGGAILTPVISQTTGSFLQVRIDNSGAGYTSAPTLVINQALPALGTGKYGNAEAVLKAIIVDGSIVNVTIEDPGVNYPADTATTINVQGDGTGALLYPVIYNGQVVDIVVENPGTDYSYAKINIIGDGAGATATAVIAASDFLSDQSQVEQVAVKGAIYSVAMTEGGNNYTVETTVSFNGDGTGAEGYCVIESGVITKVVMTSFGQNYTQVTVSFNDPNRLTPNDYTDATAYAILPPVNGHGYDAVKELYADTIGIFTAIKSDTELTLLTQDYRQYGLIKNPTDVFTNKRVTTDTNLVVFSVNVTDTEGMVVDSVLLNNNKRYRVVSIDGNNVKLQQLSSVYVMPSGVLVDETTNISFSIQTVETSPNLNKYSGDLLYTTNNAPFTPTNERSIAIRTYLKL